MIQRKKHMMPASSVSAAIAAVRFIGFVFLLVCLSPALSPSLAKGRDMTGEWVLDRELTAAAQPKYKEKKGIGNIRINPIISVGGYGFPVPTGSKKTSGRRGKLSDPDVVFADKMEISVIDGTVVLEFNEVGTEKFKPGNEHGTRTTWTGKKLSSRYKSTSRSVSQVYLLKGEDLLIVTVTIKPSGGGKKVYKKVFQRAG